MGNTVTKRTHNEVERMFANHHGHLHAARNEVDKLKVMLYHDARLP